MKPRLEGTWGDMKDPNCFSTGSHTSINCKFASCTEKTCNLTCCPLLNSQRVFKIKFENSKEMVNT